MSLDFYLQGPPREVECECDGCGHKHKRTTREEFFWRNITHNLGQMFDKAGAYQILWHGDDQKAGDVLPLLEKSLADMKARPEFYEQFNASNGWGLYCHAVPFLEAVVNACRKYPDATIYCSR